jgi:hypothetical protein
VRTIFNWIPFVNYLYYLGLYYLLEIIAYKLFRPGDMFAESVTKDARVHLEKQVSDPELRENLRPYGHIGCKRVLLSDSYYPTLQKENVELITDPPVQITETGIMSRPTLKEVNDQEFQRYTDAERSAEKNIDVDIIIWATGFTVQDRWDIYKVIGRSGKTLSDHFSTESNSLYGNLSPPTPTFLTFDRRRSLRLPGLSPHVWSQLYHPLGLFNLHLRAPIPIQCPLYRRNQTSQRKRAKMGNDAVRTGRDGVDQWTTGRVGEVGYGCHGVWV